MKSHDQRLGTQVLSEPFGLAAGTSFAYIRPEKRYLGTFSTALAGGQY